MSNKYALVRLRFFFALFASQKNSKFLYLKSKKDAVKKISLSKTYANLARILDNKQSFKTATDLLANILGFVKDNLTILQSKMGQIASLYSAFNTDN